MPKLLFLVTEDWYFCSHRLPMAIAARDAGYDVVVATRLSDQKEFIERAGVRVIPLRIMKRSSLNVLREATTFFELLFIFLRERPDLVHLVALKPAIYGSLIARLIGNAGRVNALGGLGFAFTSKKFIARMMRPILLWLFRLSFNDTRSRLILQNEDDCALLTQEAGVDLLGVRLIRSAGVDMNKYVALGMPSGIPIVMLASRMLWDKGIDEFVDAARILHMQKISARFVLVGDPDPENPSSVPRRYLQELNDSRVVEWWGYRSDMPKVLSLASVVCLPSYYGEGVPKVLIEAMACARPIVTTNMPGCRDLVRSGMNGVLIKPKDPISLAGALRDLLLDQPRCLEMGLQGRRIAEEEYALPRVVVQTLSVYSELLSK